MEKQDPNVSYIIKIVASEEGDGGNRPRGVAYNVQSPQGQGSQSEKKPAFQFTAASGLAYAAKLADEYITYQINHVVASTGSSAAQENLNRVYTLARQGAATGSAMILAAMASGPMGALITGGAAALSYMTGRYHDIQAATLGRTIEAVSRNNANRRAGVDNRNIEMLD